MTDSNVTNKVWNFANILRDDGVSYGDYLEQLTYLLFLKFVDELSKPPYNMDLGMPEGYDWQSLISKSGAELEEHYVHTLRKLGESSGILGQIFVKSLNKIQDPAKLSKLLSMIDQEEWVVMGADLKGQIYEGLLEKNAQDTKSGAGQYFTPRALIKVVVSCIQPAPNKTICDPACGTGGFLIAAYDYISRNSKLNKTQKQFLKNETFFGNEFVPLTRKLCLMNLFLHNIGEISGENLISSKDSLISDDGSRYDYVLANPPFGSKSSQTITNTDSEGNVQKEALTYNRQDFWATTNNKQLNFLQHIKTILKTTGEAAVVLPDNVLFEGGAGEAVRKQLLKTVNLHTILRLPTGIFYANGVKANILFFENRSASKEACTKDIWLYDYRTNIHHTLKQKPLTYADLEDFIKCYNPKNINKRKETYSEANPEGRWRKYSYNEILTRDKTNLDIFWLKDKSLTDLDNLPEPEILADEIIENLQAGLNSFKEIADILSE